ncbi:phosphohydrolase [Thioflexithrix psekupsensis]|uniref:Phosphohydrolase n=2 Tax=Thioflexithrix psekupsensis TaxID=1570016 RepID=A0A251X4R6_9GAMM|nr:phosphohydrolase [Thioflexithrix psekupsensis]
MFGLLAIMFYLGAAGAQYYLPRTGLLKEKKSVFILGFVAILLHAVVLYFDIFAVDKEINLGIFNAASLVAGVIAFMLLLTLLHKPVESLILMAFPLAALTIALEFIFETHRVVKSDLGMGVTLHIFISILAYSFLTISAFQAIFLAYQERQLRHKRLGWILRQLPPLQVMENLLFQMVFLGFILLSLSLLTGFIFFNDLFGQHLVHKTFFSLIAWLVFALLLWGRWRYGWRGQTAIRWNLGGFFLLLLAYFGSKFVLEVILKR